MDISQLTLFCDVAGGDSLHLKKLLENVIVGSNEVHHLNLIVEQSMT
jgi:hypothetical protein